MLGTHLGIYRKRRVPRVGRDNLANAELFGLGGDLAHVLHGIPELFLGWVVGRGIWYIVRPLLALHRVRTRRGLATPLDRAEVQGRARHGAERYLGVGRVVAVGKMGRLLRCRGGAGLGRADSRRGSQAGYGARQAPSESCGGRPSPASGGEADRGGGDHVGSLEATKRCDEAALGTSKGE